MVAIERLLPYAYRSHGGLVTAPEQGRLPSTHAETSRGAALLK